jgi:hypothetical protein
LYFSPIRESSLHMESVMCNWKIFGSTAFIHILRDFSLYLF